MIRLSHDGAIGGGSGLWCWFMPESDAFTEQVNTLGFVASMNQESYLGEAGTPMLAAVQAVEDASAWPGGDLFGAL